MTILLAGGGTGGHVYPLIAVASALQELAPGERVVFIGTARGMETRVVPASGYELELMHVLPLRGGGPVGAVRGAARALGSIPEARALLKRLAPRAVLSIGGYAAGPISLAARAARVPLALLEPNSVMGLANRLTVPFVQRAYTAFPETDAHFKPGVVRRLGVPIRAGFEPRPYPEHGDGPLPVLVLGGSQGAKSLNENVPGALAQLARRARGLHVVHQAGAGKDDEVRARYRELGFEAAEVRSFIDDMPAALGAAGLVISRSGASAVSEIAAIGRPSLLIPYPFAAGDHQRRNAESLARVGAAVCVESSAATPERIASELSLLLERGRLANMAAAAASFGRPDAARRLAEDLLDLAIAHPSVKRSVA